MRNRRLKIGVGALAALVVAALLPITAATAADADDGLFEPTASSRSYTAPDHVVRDRTVSVDFGALFQPDGRARNKGNIGSLPFNLFDDAFYVGTVTDASKDDFAVTWSGTLDVADGYFHMVVADGAFAAHLASPEGVYEVSGTGDGAYRIVQIDQSKFVDHPPGTFEDPHVGDLVSDAQLRDFEASGRGVDSGDVLDIIVFYTTEAKNSDGGEANIRARIALALAETNQSYKWSKTKTRLRLLHVEEVGYLEASFSGALNDLVNGTNGLGVAHTRRNTYGADMVGLIIDDGAFCGLAAGILPGEALAYQVTDYTCATGYYSFGHEFGHLQGAHHDQYVANNTVYAFGHGWVNLANRWRTIMAYNSECAATSPFTNCTRLQYWSNPNKNYVDLPQDGYADPMGGPSAKNYKVLDDSSVTVANWRKSRGDDFRSEFTTKHKGWGAVVGTWGVNAKGWFWSKGKVDQYASAYHSGKYGNLTFEASVKRVGCQSCATSLIIRGKRNNLKLPEKQWQPSYLFQYSNDGDYSVYKIKPNGNIVTLQTWTIHAAVKPGKWNKLKVVAVNDSLSFYINNQLVWSGTDGQLATGDLGVGFFKDNTNKNRMMVDWAEVTTTAVADLPPGDYAPVTETPATAEQLNGLEK